VIGDFGSLAFGLIWDPIRGFIRWFWRIGGLDDVKSPLWLTPFGRFLVFLSLPLLISATVIFIRGNRGSIINAEGVRKCESGGDFRLDGDAGVYVSPR